MLYWRPLRRHRSDAERFPCSAAALRSESSLYNRGESAAFFWGACPPPYTHAVYRRVTPLRPRRRGRLSAFGGELE